MGGARSAAACLADVEKAMRRDPMAFAAGAEPRRRGHPVLGYASKQDAIRALADQGLSPSEIAEKVGVTQNFVASILWRFSPTKSKNGKLVRRLRERGHESRAIAEMTGLTLDYVMLILRKDAKSRSRRMSHFSLPAEAYQQIADAAEDRGLTMEALCVRILCMVVRDQLVDAVLDDEDMTADRRLGRAQ